MVTEISNAKATIDSTDTWKIVDDTHFPVSIRCGNELIAEFHVWGWTEKLNAKFIVEAKNSHNILVTALCRIAAQSGFEEWSTTQALRFSIRHARIELALLKRTKETKQRHQTGCHFAGGTTAYCEGRERVLPTYFENTDNNNAIAWLSGWDFAKSADVHGASDRIKCDHTPTPWSVGIGSTSYYPVGVFAEDEAMLVAFHSFDKDRNKKAHLITRVCNSHEKLKSTLVAVADIDLNTISSPEVTLSRVITMAKDCLREASGNFPQ